MYQSNNFASEQDYLDNTVRVSTLKRLDYIHYPERPSKTATSHIAGLSATFIDLADNVDDLCIKRAPIVVNKLICQFPSLHKLPKLGKDFKALPPLELIPKVLPDYEVLPPWLTQQSKQKAPETDVFQVEDIPP